MGLFKKKSSAKETYAGLRALALAAQPDGAQPGTVYAAAVDIPLNENRMATLACSVDGTVSLYFNSGGGLLGGGQASEAVRAAGESLLSGAEQALKYLERTSDVSPRLNGKTSVFLLTAEGTYFAEYDISAVSGEGRHLQLLSLLVQNVLSALRTGGGTL